jgi:hypothetical protein
MIRYIVARKFLLLVRPYIQKECTSTVWVKKTIKAMQIKKTPLVNKLDFVLTSR